MEIYSYQDLSICHTRASCWDFKKKKCKNSEIKKYVGKNGMSIFVLGKFFTEEDLDLIYLFGN